MIDFSENNLKLNCPHCDSNSFALKYPLEETGNFWIVCDVHPITEGHILIIPKKHLSCIGEYSNKVFLEFVNLYDRFSEFIEKEYGSISTFEHGNIGQTVFHSHVHLFPFKGSPTRIVPEGFDNIKPIKNISDLRRIFLNEGKYLFFSISNNKWTVNTKLGAPRFFRDRFASVLGVPDRGNWKEMESDKELMAKAVQEMKNLQKKWLSYKNK